MAVGKVPPLRQQMINMMYLVLTALLAMNVSAEVLRAFNLVNNGLERTTSTYESKNADIYQAFEQQLKDDPERVQPIKEKAEKVREYSNELYTYIEKIKQDMIKEGGGRDPENENRIEDEKNLDIATRELAEGSLGKELKQKVLETRQKYFSVVPQTEVTIPLDAVDPKIPGEKETWQGEMFRDVPLTAAITMLAKLQNDVRNAEGELINYLFKSIKGDIINFDVVQPMVRTSSNFVMLGEEFTADIQMGAYSSTQEFKVEVNGEPVEVSGGSAKYIAKPSSEGIKTIQGTITYKGAKGEEKVDTFETTIQVFKGSATISADAMNVLYIGLENPISISVPGFPPDKIRASMSRGTLSGSNGRYIAKVTGGRSKEDRTTTISASVQTGDGRSMTMGSATYRIRPVPAPTAYFGNKASGAITKAELGAQQGIISHLGEGFAFEGLNFRVQRFTLIYQPRNGDMLMDKSNDWRITSRMKTFFGQARPGDQIIVTDIYAAAAGVGEKRLDNGIVLQVR
ncbi:MAG: gliding motility protein GldM [Bacteroidia bacterium]